MKPFRLLLVRLGRRTFSFPFATPPMGVISLAAYAREKFPKAEISVIDGRVNNLSVDEVLERARAFGADVVGLSSLTSFAHLLAPITEGIREATPGALVVIGGPHASAFRDEALTSSWADAAVVGEGEIALERIIEARLGGEGLDTIPGLIWRDASGEVTTNPGVLPAIEDLDALPFPAYDLLNMEDYWRVPPMSALPVRRYVSFFTSRGCPYRCIYCHCIFGNRFRAQSAERMADEVAYFTKKYHVREIEFLDDMINLDAQRLLDFCDLVHRRGMKLRINLPNSLRVDILTEDVIDALVDTGLYHASFALETGSPRMQKLIRKHLDIPKFLRNLEYSTRKGIFANGFTMLGFPTETEEELLTTIDTACNAPFHTATFFTVVPYPATELYELARQTHPERLEQLTYINTDYHNIRINFSEVPDDVFFAHQRNAWRRFFLRPGRLFRLVRDYPGRRYLPYYFPKFFIRQMKGLLHTA